MSSHEFTKTTEKTNSLGTTLNARGGKSWTEGWGGWSVGVSHIELRDFASRGYLMEHICIVIIATISLQIC